jgi:hypothetical protein
MKNLNYIGKSLILSLILMTSGAVFISQGQCISPTAQVVPSHIKVVKGDSVRINVKINGTEPMDYQWFYLSTGIIKGATKPSYTAHHVMKADTIYLRVMNKCGQTFSNPVYIEIDTVTPSKQQTKVAPKAKAATKSTK